MEKVIFFEGEWCISFILWCHFEPLATMTFNFCLFFDSYPWDKVSSRKSDMKTEYVGIWKNNWFLSGYTHSIHEVLHACKLGVCFSRFEVYIKELFSKLYLTSIDSPNFKFYRKKRWLWHVGSIPFSPPPCFPRFY